MLELDQERWLTYAEAGKLLGISTQAARMLAKRRGWARRTPNAYGDRARICVPTDVIVQGNAASLEVRTGHVSSTDEGAPNGHEQVNVRALEIAVDTLREQLGIANQQVTGERTRADRAEQRAENERRRADDERERGDRERDRADQAERRATELLADQRARQQSLQRRRWWQLRRRRNVSAP